MIFHLVAHYYRPMAVIEYSKICQSADNLYVRKHYTNTKTLTCKCRNPNQRALKYLSSCNAFMQIPLNSFQWETRLQYNVPTSVWQILNCRHRQNSSDASENPPFTNKAPILVPLSNDDLLFTRLRSS